MIDNKNAKAIPSDFTHCFMCADNKYNYASFKKRLVEGFSTPLWTCGNKCFETMMESFIKLAVPPPRVFFVLPSSNKKMKTGRHMFSNVKDFETWCLTNINDKNRKKYEYGVSRSSAPIDVSILTDFCNYEYMTDTRDIFWGREDGYYDINYDWKQIIESYKNFNPSSPKLSYCPSISIDDESLVYQLDLSKFYKTVESSYSKSIARYQKAKDELKMKMIDTSN